MNCFLVDYENVHVRGLHGISALSNEDKVVVFYPDREGPLSYPAYRKLTQSKANVSIEAVFTSGKNALDFQLCTCLGYLIGKNAGKSVEYYIVSRAKDYEALADYWFGQNVNVSLIPAISDALAPDSVKETPASPKQPSVQDALSQEDVQTQVKYLLPGRYEAQIPIIAEIVWRHPMQQDAHKELAKVFHQGPDVRYAEEIYRIIKPLLLSDKQKMWAELKRLLPEVDELSIPRIAKIIRRSETKLAVREELERVFDAEAENSVSGGIYERIQPLLADKE